LRPPGEYSTSPVAFRNGPYTVPTAPGPGHRTGGARSATGGSRIGQPAAREISDRGRPHSIDASAPASCGGITDGLNQVAETTGTGPLQVEMWGDRPVSRPPSDIACRSVSANSSDGDCTGRDRGFCLGLFGTKASDAEPQFHGAQISQVEASNSGQAIRTIVSGRPARSQRATEIALQPSGSRPVLIVAGMDSWLGGFRYPLSFRSSCRSKSWLPSNTMNRGFNGTAPREPGDGTS